MPALGPVVCCLDCPLLMLLQSPGHERESCQALGKYVGCACAANGSHAGHYSLVSAPSLNRSSAPPVSSGASKDVKIVDLPQSVPPSAALHALLDYHGDLPGVSPSRSANSSADAQSPIAYYLQELQQLKQHSSQTDGMKQLQCLIALVPDPLDSHFPLTSTTPSARCTRLFAITVTCAIGKLFFGNMQPKAMRPRLRPGAINPAPCCSARPSPAIRRRPPPANWSWCCWLARHRPQVCIDQP